MTDCIIEALIEEIAARRQLHVHGFIGLAERQELRQDRVKAGSVTISHEQHFVGARIRVIHERIRLGVSVEEARARSVSSGR